MYLHSSPESVSRPNNSGLMPSAELSYDAYRFRRLNDQDSSSSRQRNVAKVEPYSINTNTVRPLYQSSSPTTAQSGPMSNTTVPTIPSKARINIDSMGNTPTNSSTSSSAGSFGSMMRHSNILQSDFITPNPAYPTLASQPLPNSSFFMKPSMPPSEPLSHGSLHQLSAANIPSYNGRATSLTSSTNTFQQPYPSSTQRDFHASMVRIIIRLYDQI